MPHTSGLSRVAGLSKRGGSSADAIEETRQSVMELKGTVRDLAHEVSDLEREIKLGQKQSEDVTSLEQQLSKEKKRLASLRRKMAELVRGLSNGGGIPAGGRSGGSRATTTPRGAAAASWPVLLKNGKKNALIGGLLLLLLAGVTVLYGRSVGNEKSRALEALRQDHMQLAEKLLQSERAKAESREKRELSEKEYHAELKRLELVQETLSRNVAAKRRVIQRLKNESRTFAESKNEMVASKAAMEARYQSDIARSHEEHAALQSEHESALTSQKEQLEASIAAQRDVVNNELASQRNAHEVEMESSIARIAELEEKFRTMGKNVVAKKLVIQRLKSDATRMSDALAETERKALEREEAAQTEIANEIAKSQSSAEKLMTQEKKIAEIETQYKADLETQRSAFEDRIRDQDEDSSTRIEDIRANNEAELKKHRDTIADLEKAYNALKNNVKMKKSIIARMKAAQPNRNIDDEALEARMLKVVQKSLQKKVQAHSTEIDRLQHLLEGQRDEHKKKLSERVKEQGDKWQHVLDGLQHQYMGMLEDAKVAHTVQLKKQVGDLPERLQKYKSKFEEERAARQTEVREIKSYAEREISDHATAQEKKLAELQRDAEKAHLTNLEKVTAEFSQSKALAAAELENIKVEREKQLEEKNRVIATIEADNAALKKNVVAKKLIIKRMKSTMGALDAQLQLHIANTLKLKEEHLKIHHIMTQQNAKMEEVRQRFEEEVERHRTDMDQHFGGGMGDDRIISALEVQAEESRKTAGIIRAELEESVATHRDTLTELEVRERKRAHHALLGCSLFYPHLSYPSPSSPPLPPFHVVDCAQCPLRYARR